MHNLKKKPIWLPQVRHVEITGWNIGFYALKRQFDQIRRFVSTYILFSDLYLNRWIVLWYLSLGFSLVFSFWAGSTFLSDRGVVNCLWFSPRWSNRPGVLCEGCQGVLLRRSGHILVLDCPSFMLKCSKVRGKNSALRGGFSVEMFI